MKFNSKFSVAVHTLIFISEYTNDPITSSNIANSVCTNNVVIRQILQRLKSNGLIDSKQGRSSITLTRLPSEITMLDIYDAIDDDSELFKLHPGHNDHCLISANIELIIDDISHSAELALRKDLSMQTLEDVIKKIYN